MIRTHFIPVLIGVLLIFLGFVAGRLTVPTGPGELAHATLATAEAHNPAAGEPDSGLTVELTPDPGSSIATPIIPTLDVPGSDIPGLPRYPDARRVEYRQRVEDNLIVTEAEYVTTADFETVHNYYRNVFSSEGWLVADLSFYQGEWTFLVIAGGREALVEVEARGPLVEVEIEISEPQSSSTLLPATLTPTPGFVDDD